MIFEGAFTSHGFESIVAYSGKDITDEMIDECLKIDELFYDEKYYLNNAELKETVKNFGQMCFVFYDTEVGKVIGYSFWLTVKTKVINSFVKEKRMLLDIKPLYCTKVKEGETVNLFSAGEAFVSGYDLGEMHKSIEDIFQKRILDLAYKNIKVKYIAIEAVCKYDEEYLVKLLGLTNSIKKDKSTFYYGEYSPKTVYSRSKYATELLRYYK